eukprot:251176-Rhodomonas_salina.3
MSTTDSRSACKGPRSAFHHALCHSRACSAEKSRVNGRDARIKGRAARLEPTRRFDLGARSQGRTSVSESQGLGFVA